MPVAAKQHAKNLWLVVSGKVMWDGHQDLKDALTRYSGQKISNLWLDLRDVSIIDSLGLGTLMGVKMTCAKNAIRLRLVSPPPGVMDTLRKVKFDAVFEILDVNEADTIIRHMFPAEDDAVSSGSLDDSAL